MDGFGHFLAGLFSSPRVTSGSLAIAAALLLAIDAFAGILPEGSIGEIATAIAWGVALFAGSFFGLTVIVDLFKWIRPKAVKSEPSSNLRKLLKNAGEDTLAIVAYLAVRNKDEIWLMQGHPGSFDFRALGFGRLSDNFGGAEELTLHRSVGEWLQSNLDAIRSLQISKAAADRLAASHAAASSAIEHRWMAY